MYEELIQKVKKAKPGVLSDEEILAFIEEAVIKTCTDGNEFSSGVYLDDTLFYYVMAQIALFSGDLTEYSNYCILYNNAAASYRKDAFIQTPNLDGNDRWNNLW